MSIGANALAIISPLLLLLFGLGFTVLIDPYIQKKQKRTMLIIAALCLTGRRQVILIRSS